MSKTFGGRTVLRDFKIEIARGEIHGLVGQNGSGKSTVIKILSGFHEPDHGTELEVRGKEVTFPISPNRVHDLGMVFVHQDLGLIESASVVENVRIGRYATRLGWRVPWREERRRVEALLRSYNINVAPDATVSSLRPVDKAMVAIARALGQATELVAAGDASEGVLMVLDEPTPHLPRDGVEALFDTVKRLAADGVGILFVTHRLEEILELTDTVSVLRDGELVSTHRTSELTTDALVEQILGFSLADLYPEPSHGDSENVVLRASNVRGENVVDFSCSVGRGEIVGLTGLVGMGWEGIPYLMFGAIPARGEVIVHDRTLDLHRLTPRRAISAGICLVPADRHGAGVLLDASVSENITLPTLGEYYKRGLLQRRREARRVRQLMEDFDVRPRHPTRPLATLSGGNQQKVVIGKWFETNPRVLLLHEPTQGVDVGARAQIFERVRAAADGGAVVLYASAEWEDLAHLCDRVLVFRNGRVASELKDQDLTLERIAEQSFRVAA